MGIVLYKFYLSCRKRELGFQYVNREDVIYGFAKLFSGAFASYQNRAPGFEVAKNVMVR